LESE
jgi:hypothetical protein